MVVRVEAFDLLDDEVRVLLDGEELVAVLAPPPRDGGGKHQSILLPGCLPVRTGSRSTASPTRSARTRGVILDAGGVALV